MAAKVRIVVVSASGRARIRRQRKPALTVDGTADRYASGLPGTFLSRSSE